MTGDHDSLEPRQNSFATTRWSVVLAAGADGTPDAQAALATLCGEYWFPLFSFARRSGHDAETAKDLTQGFFEALLTRNFLQDIDPGLGRFRSFLLAAFKHFIANQHRADRALKRGGGKRLVSFHVDEAESRYNLEPYHEQTAEQAFDRQWALTLLDQVLKLVEREYEGTGRKSLFEVLRPLLAGEPSEPYQAVAERLGMTENAVKTAAYRLRVRFGETLRQEIARTVETPEEVQDEVQRLFEILRAR